MDDKLKFRLVGAAVILAVMAFFLPLILDSEKYRTEIVPQIPPMPVASQNNSVDSQSDAISNPNIENINKNSSDNSGTLVIDLDKDIGEIEKRANQVSIDEEKKATDSGKELVAVVKDKEEISVDLVKQEAEVQKETAKKSITKATEKNNIGNPAKESPAIKTATNDDNKVIAKNDIDKVVTAEVEKAADSVKKQIVKKGVKPIVPAKAPDFQEKAYVIQIGTFSNKDNASKLVNDLRSQEYRAYQRISDDFSRVYVGPYPDKNIADKRSSTLSKIVATQVKVLEFDPIKH